MEAWNSPPRVDVADVLRIESGIIGSTFTVVLSFTGNGKVLGRYEATTDEEVDAILDTISEMLASTEAPAPVPAALPRSPYADPEVSAQERAEWVKSGGHLAWVWNEPERQWYELGTLGGKGVDAYAAPASNVVDGTTGVRFYRLSNGSESARDWLRGVWGYMGTLPSQKPAISPSNDAANQDDAKRIARFGVDIRGITISMGTIPVVSVFYSKTRSVKEYARFADGMENAGFWLVEATTHPWPMDVHFEGNLSRNLSDSEWKMLDEIVTHGLPEKMAKEYRNGLKRYESLRAEIATAQTVRAVSDPAKAQKPTVIVPFATIQQEKPSRPTTNESLHGFDLPRKSATLSKRSPAEGVIEFEVRLRVDERDPVSSQDGERLVNDALQLGDETLRVTKNTYFVNEIRRATCETSLFTGDCIWTGTLRGEMAENSLDDSNAVNYRRFLDATTEAEAAMFESLESEQIDVVQSWIVQMQTPWGKELHEMIQTKKEADRAKADAEKAEKAREKAARKAAAPALDPEHDRPRDTSDTLPDPALVGRIDGMLIARGLPAGRSGKAIATAIQTGNYSDILHTDNTNSRAIFTELTDVKLPKTIKGTKELFVGKPFSVKPGMQEKEVSPYEKAQRIAASTGHILWIPSRGISASEKAHLVSIGMIATPTPNHTGEVGPGWLGKNTSVVHEAINRIDTTEER